MSIYFGCRPSIVLARQFLSELKDEFSARSQFENIESHFRTVSHLAREIMKRSATSEETEITQSIVSNITSPEQQKIVKTRLAKELLRQVICSMFEPLQQLLSTETYSPHFVLAVKSHLRLFEEYCAEILQIPSRGIFQEIHIDISISGGCGCNMY